MAKLCLKKPSKRLTCKKKFKIQKKVKEHSKKVKKLAKEKSRKRMEKPVSIPNKCPFKEQLLMEAEKKREERKEEQLQKKVQQKAEKKLGKKHSSKSNTVGESMEALAKRAAKEEENFTENQYLLENLPERVEHVEGGAKSVKSYAAEVRKTIESADIVFEVLDARDPLGSRSAQIERLVLEGGKRLVLLLNKIDLVPKENLLKWLAYLRLQLPTIAFKASTQEQNAKLGRFSYSNLLNAQNTSKCVGAELVMKLLGNYCRNKDVKTSIRVGIVGYPNVGKSSVINSLKRKKSCQTGATPGLTKQLQEVELGKHIRLLDSPGVVLAPKDKLLDAAELALKNVVRVETLADPVTPVQAILRRCSVKVLMLHYRIPEFADCEQFLALLARRLGRLRRGGRADLNAAAKQVLNDWNSGKLRYYTEPPEHVAHGDGGEQLMAQSAELLAEFSKEFELDALEQDIRVLVDAMPEDHMALDTAYNPEEDDHRMETDQDQAEDEHGEIVVTGGGMGKKAGDEPMESDKSGAKMPDSLAIGDGNVRLGRAIKQVLKKRKKQRQKLANKAEKLADKLVSGMELE